MTGIVESPPKATESIPFLQDGRVFAPSFEDGGTSYSRLIGALQQKYPADELQKLADSLVGEYEALRARFAKVDTEQTPRSSKLHYLKLRAAALLLRDLVRQGWIIQVEQGRITLYPLPPRKKKIQLWQKKLPARLGYLQKRIS